MAYIPNTDADRAVMLDAVGVGTLDSLFETIPAPLRFMGELEIPPRLDQISLTRRVTELALKNTSADRYPIFLGAGVYDHYIPPTVAAITGRSEFYTSYTPYQPEMSQGVLQSIFEFQSLVCSLTQMDVANASMYDGATALAEAVIMAAELAGRKRILLPDTVNREYRRVVQTYIEHMGLELKSLPATGGRLDLANVENALGDDIAAIVVQHPNFCGMLEDVDALGAAAKRHGALVISVYHPISLGLLKPPGAYDADIAVAEGQSLGCPMGYGGPLLGLFGCKQQYLRRIPGRLIGQTTDQDGKRAFVMTLRTREQDIRRERATSNICTNEALNALAACVYIGTMGKQGMRQVAELCVQKAHYAATSIAALPGYRLAYPDVPFFNEFVVRCPVSPEVVNEKLLAEGILGGLPLGAFDPDLADAMLICVTEQRLKDEIDKLVAVLGGMKL